jgi:hypothetical protein
MKNPKLFIKIQGERERERERERGIRVHVCTGKFPRTQTHTLFSAFTGDI